MFLEQVVKDLLQHPQIAFYFRYPLHPSDFRELHEGDHILGRYAAKPLYGRLTPEGRVDRSAGFNGQIAILFLPARVRTARAARLILTRMPKEKVRLANGRRNWPAIRVAAERAIRKWYAGHIRPRRGT